MANKDNLTITKQNSHRTVLEDQTKILILDDHCLYEIFNCLSYKDLVSVAKTCTQLNRVASEFFRLNHKNRMVRAENDGIHLTSIQVNIFSDCIQKISISGDRLGAYRYVGANCTSIKHFRVYGSLPDKGFECVKSLLKGVKFLEFNECLINCEFYENCLKFCTNATTLSITRSGKVNDASVIIGTGNEWMLRNYPKLENFELTDFPHDLHTNELQKFFEKNQNIRTFSTDSQTLWGNRRSLLSTKVKLDTIAIDVYQTQIRINNKRVSLVDCVYYLLIELGKREFYKRLHFYLFFVDPSNVNKMMQLDAIEMVMGQIRLIDRPLSGYKAMGIWEGDELLQNIDDLPKYLPDIDRLIFLEIGSSSLVRLAGSLPKLRKILIRRCGISAAKAVDLFAINRERNKLVDACKLTIYDKEEYYLLTKAQMGITKLNMVELGRFESVEWEELNARAKYMKSI